MISAGLYSLVTVFNFIQTYGEEGLNIQYDFSDGYYNNLGNYYKDIYNAYYGNPKAIDTNRLETIHQKKGYYYLVKTSTGRLYSNIPNLKTVSDFYSIVEYSERMDGFSEPVSTRKNIYFEIKPPFQEEVMVGMSPEQYSTESKYFLYNYYSRTMPLFYTLGGCAAILLLGLFYLAFVSGRKPNSDALHFHHLDNFFLDVYLVVWIILELLQNEFAANIANALSEEGILILAMILSTICGLLGILYWTMVSKRIKQRSLFKHTLVYFIIAHTLGWCWRKVLWLAGLIKNGPFQLLPIAITVGFLAYNAITVIIGVVLSSGFGFPGFLVGAFIYLSGFGLLMTYLIYQDQQLECVLATLSSIADGNMNEKLSISGTKQFKRLAAQINALTHGLSQAVQKELKAERMKGELITNVSHDIKTPLTSIINYVDLLKTQGLDAPDAPKYLEVLDQKSQRLKQLTEDLFEASKASTGNLQVVLEPLNYQDLVRQATGEFAERFESASLNLVLDMPKEPLLIQADGRYLWRILENIFLNVYKYAAPNTRVYLILTPSDIHAELTLKNISDSPLNLSSDELLERFTRGDLSRNTEGSGLGLSIAKSLAELQQGSFELQTDGDLFKVILKLPLADKVSNLA